MATTPPIDLDVDIHLTDEARRLIALEHAVNLAATQQVGRYDGEVVLNVAKAFEAYLKADAA